MRNKRVTITITRAQYELLDDLDRFPTRAQASRIRDLAMIGLLAFKPFQPQPKPEPPPARERAHHMRQFK